ncbi:UDP-N-acetylglucosamine--N-acetylmuramyl-(pentapeptide) pyrophosphoryl-undecaprenol N-acetylglucosamine transferase [Sphaerochaeta globosa]|uniref:UDP-N-acetylglucosamine--N-acetylmuramyl-(pentapeptide) pyrophosphoryl-undecaprenol N-acetylglucosamine transferase n=1 Tax=Sphaerochaeta globosa (strain ATCC BAA-1886 / DSM 22777 / Buddy) TaxID=158189 RepID=F0RYW7_SPHGB|nr:UDP-N-acetylglucosamine--N-acetylmuramyl-(pentapeptide) pyrophosphoryl-undecaprenol N-acetylglucosamine transferase [Sphaerochaeta globosa]ADY13103.1 UDP-N-acetylglucosamine--N-acetylmuramyl-(pentapeptide) pyrophosphoryl-undecaprenol N-acetylglucosamine transferase [Sphaerochaeta globosa str. Buddy]
MVVCYTGGGTLGHIYPALAVHEELVQHAGYRAFWIGRDENSEREVVQKQGIPFFAIRSGKLRRYRSIQNLLDIGNVLSGFWQAFFILKRNRADVLFSKGGFVSVPPVLAAFFLGIPVVSHESDASAGLATRINAHFSRYVCVPFAQGFESIKASKRVVTGNPIRSGLVEKADTPYDETELPFIGRDDKLLLVLGGSSGSQQINALVRTHLEALTQMAYVYHQCGSKDVQNLRFERYTEVAFITDLLPSLLKRADLVVSRAGANTIAELALFGCPSLLIPLGREYSRGDQIDNALHLASLDAARTLVSETDLNRFVDEVKDLLDNRQKRTMLSENSRKLAQKDCAHRIAELLCSMKE